MYCKYCGTQISDDSLYCSHCGKQLEKNSKSYISFVKRLLKSVKDIWFLLCKNLGSLFSKIKGALFAKGKKELQENEKNSVNLSAPIIRTQDEELYRLRTGVYRLREIPSGYFKCPCCGNLFPIALHPTINGADTKTTVVGRRVRKETLSYKISICSDCHRYQIFESNILLFTFLGSLIISIVTMCCIDSIDIAAAFALSFPVFMGSGILGLIVMHTYRIFVGIIYKKNLSISFHKSAEYGAVRTM